jgi:hypothetical protein
MSVVLRGKSSLKIAEKEKKRKEGEIRELTGVRMPNNFEHQPYCSTHQSCICNLDRISICSISRHSRAIALGDKTESAIATTNKNQDNFSFLVTPASALAGRVTVAFLLSLRSLKVQLPEQHQKILGNTQKSWNQ